MNTKVMFSVVCLLVYCVAAYSQDVPKKNKIIYQDNFAETSFSSDMPEGWELYLAKGCEGKAGLTEKTYVSKPYSFVIEQTKGTDGVCLGRKVIKIDRNKNYRIEFMAKSKGSGFFRPRWLTETKVWAKNEPWKIVYIRKIDNWKKFTLLLDQHPSNAEYMMLMVGTRGPGQKIWIDDLTIEEISPDQK